MEQKCSQRSLYVLRLTVIFTKYLQYNSEIKMFYQNAKVIICIV
jgi:hypothetical protein